MVTYVLFLSINAKAFFQQEVTQSEEYAIRYFEFDSLYDLNSFSYSALDSTFYTIDQSTFEIKKYGYEGGLITKTGREGKGPSEFQSRPEKIKFNEKRRLVGVIDREAFRVVFFDEDLNYHSQINTKFPPYDFDFIGNEKMIISCLPVDNAVDAILVYNFKNQKYELDFSFNPILDRSNLILDAFQVRSLNEGKVLLVFNFRNLIQVYSNTGALITSFSVDGVPLISETESIDTRMPSLNMVPTEFLFQSVSVSSDSQIFILHRKEKMVLKVNAEGKLIQRYITIDEPKNIFVSGTADVYVENKSDEVDGNTIALYFLKDD